MRDREGGFTPTAFLPARFEYSRIGGWELTMTFSRIHVSEAFSLREFINVENTGNILLGNQAHISSFVSVIVQKILGGRLSDAEVHVRLSDHRQLRGEIELFKQLAAAGVPIYVWTTEKEAESNQFGQNTVIINENFPIASENFLIVATLSDARSLVWWASGYRAPEATSRKSGEVIGLLVTYPDETRHLLSKIHSVLGQ
jgi:hypothetical protein